MANNPWQAQPLLNPWGQAPAVWGQGMLGLVQPQEHEEDVIVFNDPNVLQEGQNVAQQVANVALPQ